MAEAGKLKHRVAIWRSASTDDGTATVLGPPAEIGKRWASKQDVSDAERIRAAQQGAEVTTRFRMRRDGLTATVGGADVLRYRGRDYAVTGVKDVDDDDDLIEITTSAKSEGTP